jgi:hypothetical protein
LLDERVNAKTGRRQKNNLFQRKLIMGVITRTKRARQAKICQIFHLEYFGDGDIDDENKINYTLYNFPNIYHESDIDYYTFKACKTKKNEIIGYDRISYSKFEEKIISLLCNLKYVRY